MKPEVRRPGGLLALLVALACFFPFAYLLALSLAGPWPFPRLLPEFFTAGRWNALLGDQVGLLVSLCSSLILSAAVAMVSTALGFLSSRAVACHARRRLLLFLAYLPFVFSPAILAACLLHVYLRLNLAGSWLGVGLAQLLLAYSFAIVFFQGFWNRETRALGDLVATLGGSGWQLYRRVYLPLGREMLEIAFFQTFLLSFFQYGSTVLIGGGAVKTLPVEVYHFVGEADPHYAALAGCLLVWPPFLLLWLNRRFVFRTPL
jgi:putative spermidine/putrescine transport system permease protein